jgi:hypothetical protein
MTKRQPPADAPSNGIEPAPAPAQEPEPATCFRCGHGGGGYFGEVVKDPRGWWLHSSCRRWVEAEAERWKR